MAGQRTDQVRESAAQHATLPPSARKQYWMLCVKSLPTGGLSDVNQIRFNVRYDDPGLD